jgi:HAD superfamily hydrolase (TIGR01509 family)
MIVQQKPLSLFWDNDGVLVETEELYYEATYETLKGFGISFDFEMYRQFFLVQNSGMTSVLEKLGLDIAMVAKLRQKRDAHYTQLLNEKLKPSAVVEQVLRSCSKHFHMAIVTSSRREHFEVIHSRTGFLKFFEFVITEGDYQHSKPHPEPYLNALARSGRKAHECLAIEDSERGLQAAKAAGLSCWVIPSALTIGGDFHLADRVLSSIEEVPKLLLEITA